MSAKTLAELSEIIGGQIVGCEQTFITHALPLQDAVPGCISLVEADQPLPKVVDSPASALLVRAVFEGCPKPQLVVDELHPAFQQVIQIFRPHRTQQQSGVHVTASVDSGSTVGAETYIGPGVNIGPECSVGRRCHIHSGVQIMEGCVVGDDCTIFPNVVLQADTKIGDRTIIQAGVVVGAFGFGYKSQDGVHHRAAQLGWVEIGDDVEIGANSTIDRGTYGPTKIGSGTKMDNLVQVGHNCHVGKHNLICAQVGLAGSSSTGDYVILAGQVGLADHIHLGDRTVVGAQSGVMRNIDPDEVVMGSPAMPRMLAMKMFANETRIPEIRKEVRKLQKEFSRMQAALARPSDLESPQPDAA